MAHKTATRTEAVAAVGFAISLVLYICSMYTSRQREVTWKPQLVWLGLAMLSYIVGYALAGVRLWNGKGRVASGAMLCLSAPFVAGCASMVVLYFAGLEKVSKLPLQLILSLILLTVTYVAVLGLRMKNWLSSSD